MAVIISENGITEVIICNDEDEANEIVDFRKTYAMYNNTDIKILLTDNIIELR